MIAVPLVAPGHGLLAIAGQTWAIMRAEITMQWRRWGLWVAFAAATGLLILLTVQAGVYLLHLPPTSLYVRQHYTPADLNNLMIESTTTYGVMFFGLIAALLVADRMGRDQRLNMVDLQRAAPLGYANYILGKFLGNYIAMLVPALLGYLFCGLTTLLLGWPGVLLAKFLQAFLLVFVLSSLAAIGLTFLLASFLPLRIVQVGFSLLWFYFETGLGQYGFGASIFNPSGLYIYPVFFPISRPLLTIVKIEFSLQLALLNLAVLLLTAIVTLALTYGSLVIQQQRAEVK